MSSGNLCVVLLSPPLTSGSRTLRAVRQAAEVIGCAKFRIANLITVPTWNLRDLDEKALDQRVWIDSRSAMANEVASAGRLLFAWGLLRNLRLARPMAEAQVRWLIGVADEFGHQEAWSVGSDVRHPSRWHQFTSDKYARTGGGTPEERLKQVLYRRPLSEFKSMV